MKKFFITLLFLVLIAGALFLFGWAQLGIPADGCGVIRSKTHGLYPRIVQPGEFQWIWYKLIPTNTETTVIRLKPFTHEFAVKSALPSGKIYSTFAGIDNDFSWEIDAAITFSLNPDTVISLFSENTVSSQEDLNRYERNAAGDIEGFILQRIEQEDDAQQVEELLNDAGDSRFENEVLDKFPFLNGFSLRIKSAKLPDFTLYKKLRGLFEDYLTLQKDYISGNSEEKAKRRIDNRIRFDELELYGALLTKYPILLEYLTIENSKK